MIEREISGKILSYIQKYPVITLTGVRQCGKSTLLRNLFSDYEYVSLEDVDIRDFAKEDPRGFLQNYNKPCIFDEIQRVPELFSYIQTVVDLEGTMGKYILSGSNNFLLMQSVSQSLAGRSAVLNLAPLSISELAVTDYYTKDVNKLMLKGFYPAMYSRNMEPCEYFPSYVMTYIERDVRLLRNIPDADSFTRFIRILATRSGQVVNYADLSKISGVSLPTVKAWLSILEQSYLIFFLKPYYKNYSKRLVKSPKLYFYDSGLLCFMLGIETEDQLFGSEYRGAVFESMVVSDCVKSKLFEGKLPQVYYWRDSNGNEVDLLVEEKGVLKTYEIKSGSTMERKYLSGLKKFAEISNEPMSEATVVFSGEKSYMGQSGNFVRYDETDW